jgi:segregation and condensation protein B
LNLAKKEASTYTNQNLTQKYSSVADLQSENSFLKHQVEEFEITANVTSVKPENTRTKKKSTNAKVDSISKPLISTGTISTRKPPPRLPREWRDYQKNLARQNIQPSLQPINSESRVQTKRIVEAILFASGKPLTVKQIQQTFPELEQPDTLEIQNAIDDIIQDYLQRPIVLKKLASGYRFQVKEGMAYWVSRLFTEKPVRYSRAMMETLSIIAYRQPVTRGEIEEIRGVAVSTNIIHTLLEQEWVRVVAHKEAPGRPALYATTKQFLDYFNLNSLDQLPPIEELAQLDFNNTLSPLQQENCETTQIEFTSTIENQTIGQTDAKTAAADKD